VHSLTATLETPQCLQSHDCGVIHGQWPVLGDGRILRSCSSRHSSASFKRSARTQRDSPNSSGLDLRVGASSSRNSLQDFDLGFHANCGNDHSNDNNDNNEKDSESSNDEDIADPDDGEAAHLFLHLIIPCSRGTKKPTPITVTRLTTAYSFSSPSSAPTEPTATAGTPSSWSTLCAPRNPSSSTG
jgi:hypothetical protein